MIEGCVYYPPLMKSTVMNSNLTYEEFARIDLRTGTITKVEEFPKARKPAFKAWPDFGTQIGVLQTSAQITKRYTHDALVSKQILGCVGEKNIGGFVSQFLLCGFADDNGDICLAVSDAKVPDGHRLY